MDLMAFVQDMAIAGSIYLICGLAGLPFWFAFLLSLVLIIITSASEPGEAE